MKQKNWLLRLSVCLATGGLGMVAVMCLFVGFGFSTVIGKEAVYLYLLLQGANVALITARERMLLRSAQAPVPSKKMRFLRLGTKWFWRLGVLTLLASLVMVLCGMLLSNPWVVLTCWIGFGITVVGWLGRLMTYHRMEQSCLALRQEKERKQQG